MKPKGNSIEELNVGKVVRRIMFENGMNKARLSRKIGRDSSGVKVLINRTSMQTYILWELSLALNYNFFADLAQQLDDATETELQRSGPEGLNEPSRSELLQEIERLKEERDYLRKAVDLISRK